MKIIEFEEAIRYIEKNIEIGNNDLIVNTEFGKIVIDVNYEDYGPDVQVLVENWSTAPDTKFNMINVNCKADYYVCIANPSSKLTLHMRVVEAMYRVMFKNTLEVDITNEIADAAVLIHRYEKEGKMLTVNMLHNDFCKHNLGIMVRGNDMVQWLVRQHVERRLDDAKKIVIEASEMMDMEIASGGYHYVCMDNYTRQIFGLMLYIAKKHNINLRNKLMITMRGNRAFLSTM